MVGVAIDNLALPNNAPSICKEQFDVDYSNLIEVLHNPNIKLDNSGKLNC